MDHQITDEDLEFMRWLDSTDGDQNWEKDVYSEKVILRSGCEKAQEEYNRIKSLNEKSESDLKVWATTHSI